jgi:hypothetical protein
MAVLPDGTPSLNLFRKPTNPTAGQLEAGEPGVHLGISPANDPQVLVAGRGKDGPATGGIYLGINSKGTDPQPVIMAVDAHGGVTFQAP